MEIAVFGGTFDPPTLAHEGIIRACLHRTDIDEVWLMPSGVRDDKPGMQPDETRLAMLSIVRQDVFRAHPKLKISDFELQLPRPTKTYSTVGALEQRYPKEKFWFIFGADSYRDMHSWEQGEELRRRLGMLLVSRQGYELPPESDTIRHLAVIESGLGISSTKVREAIRSERSVNQFVSKAIGQFIAQHCLYTPVQ